MNDVIIRGILEASDKLKTKLEEHKATMVDLRKTIIKNVILVSERDKFPSIQMLFEKLINENKFFAEKYGIIIDELKKYNKLRGQLRHIPELKNLDDIIPEITNTPSSLDGVIYCLEQAILGCNIICNSLINREISEKASEDLKRLRTEVRVLADSLPDDKQFLIKNIDEAITEYESGHYLASALIAARVIMYVYEKIPIENGSDQRDSDPTDLKVDTLTKRKIIDKNRKDEVLSFVKASKQARNILSHNAEVFPSLEESLSLIISTVTFCKYYKALSKY